MSRFWHLACIFALVLGGAWPACGDLLLWEVNDTDIEFVNGTGESQTIPLSTIRTDAAYDGSMDYVRVAATADDGTVSYLSFQYYDGTGQSTFGPPTVDAGEIDDWHAAGPTWANLSGYTDGTYSFAIELGNFVMEGEDEVWTVSARSQSSSYQDLVSSGYVTPGELAMPGYLPWTGGTFTSVPEPSSGVLLVIGGALLALRRRRRMAF